MSFESSSSYVVFDRAGGPVVGCKSRGEYLSTLQRLSENDIEFDQADATSSRVTNADRNTILSALGLPDKG